MIDAASDEGSRPFEGIFEVGKCNGMLHLCKALDLKRSILCYCRSYTDDSN